MKLLLMTIIMPILVLVCPLFAMPQELTINVHGQKLPDYSSILIPIKLTIVNRPGIVQAASQLGSEFKKIIVYRGLTPDNANIWVDHKSSRGVQSQKRIYKAFHNYIIQQNEYRDDSDEEEKEHLIGQDYCQQDFQAEGDTLDFFLSRSAIDDIDIKIQAYQNFFRSLDYTSKGELRLPLRTMICETSPSSVNFFHGFIVAKTPPQKPDRSFYFVLLVDTYQE